MKNIEKVLDALVKAFPGHKVDILFNFNEKKYNIYLDERYVGNFEEWFLRHDFDRQEIEIKIKASVYDIKDFLYECEGSGGVAVVMKEIERGLKEWEEGSRANN